MLVLLLRIIVFTLSTFSTLVSSLIFTATSRIIVLFIQGLRVPGQAFQGILEQLGSVIRGCLEYIVEFLLELASGVVSSLFEQLIQGISGSAVSAASTIVELVGKSKESFEGLFSDAPEVAEIITDVITNVLQNLWENYKDAVGYIVENVF